MASHSWIGRWFQRAETLKTTSDANRQAFYLYVLATAGEDVGADLDELFDTTRNLLDLYAKALMLPHTPQSAATAIRISCFQTSTTASFSAQPARIGKTRCLTGTT